jgi:hypothetical protein
MKAVRCRLPGRWKIDPEQRTAVSCLSFIPRNVRATGRPLGGQRESWTLAAVAKVRFPRATPTFAPEIAIVKGLSRTN